LMIQRYGLDLTREMVQKVCSRWPKLIQHLEAVVSRLRQEGKM